MVKTMTFKLRSPFPTGGNSTPPLQDAAARFPEGHLSFVGTFLWSILTRSERTFTCGRGSISQLQPLYIFQVVESIFSFFESVLNIFNKKKRKTPASCFLCVELVGGLSELVRMFSTRRYRREAPFRSRLTSSEVRGRSSDLCVFTFSGGGRLLRHTDPSKLCSSNLSAAD